jgi:2-polyprenyl-3-methyl-5-hydroxy-6-metoxy-1,4-benzoquinol methylase
LLERKDKPVLILGCGNSTLSYDLHLLGFTDITSIDYSTTVIDKMKEKYNNISGLKWVMLDMKNMSALQSESYYFILEKGALDAFMAK